MTPSLLETSLYLVKTDTAVRVGREVRAQMVRMEATQTELQQLLGLKQSAVARRLRGEQPFSVTELQMVAEWLQVPASALIDQPPQEVA